MSDDDGFDEFRAKHPQHSHLSGYEIDERGLADDQLRGLILDYVHDLQRRAEEARAKREEMIAQAKQVLRQLEADKARNLELNRRDNDRD
jgi:hypothetical protein